MTATIYASEIRELRNMPSTLELCGAVFHITRERVRQILIEQYGTADIQGFTPRIRLANLIGCTYKVLGRLEREGILNPIHLKGITLYNRDEAEKAALAVLGIVPAVHYYLLTCDWCSTEFEASKKYIDWSIEHKHQKYFFCSRLCLGKWAGHYAGFHAHPENSARGGRPRIEHPYKRKGRLQRFLQKIKRIFRWDGEHGKGKQKKPILPMEKECIFCNTVHNRRSLFCSVKCYDRYRTLVKYYEGIYLGGGYYYRSNRTRPIKKIIYCCVCGVEVERAGQTVRTSKNHYCDKHLHEYRVAVGSRLHDVPKRRG